MVFNSGEYTQLEVFAQITGKNALFVLFKNGTIHSTESANGLLFCKKSFSLKKNTDYQLQNSESKITLAYLSGNTTIFETGVTFLDKTGDIKTRSHLEKWYGAKEKDSFHFSAFKNWLNDPNGLCFYQGYYHLFYQFNPYEQKWHNMYWGHATSKDLVHWVHLPVVLEPQPELAKNKNLKGGAFSGSAAVYNGHVDFYLTRHCGPWQDGETTIEYQTITSSSDMLHFTPEKTIIAERPEGASYNFRDPKFDIFFGQKTLVLGSTWQGEAAILRYTCAAQSDSETWQFAGPLLTEADPSITTIECPDFFLLDGTHIALVAFMCHTDKCGRYQGTYYYTGTFDGERFTHSDAQLFDFGSNFYAVQTFVANSRRIAIGWISDFYGEHIKIVDGNYGSMGIPRELCIKNGKLYQTPVAEIAVLQGKILLESSCANAACHIPDSRARIYIELTQDTDFTILLGKTASSSIRLVRKNGVTKITTEGTASSHIRFEADVQIVSDIEIFIDRRTIEVFLNKGEAAGAKLFYRDKNDGDFEALFDNEKAVQKLSIYSMQSAWSIT